MKLSRRSSHQHELHFTPYDQYHHHSISYHQYHHQCIPPSIPHHPCHRRSIPQPIYLIVLWSQIWDIIIHWNTHKSVVFDKASFNSIVLWYQICNIKYNRIIHISMHAFFCIHCIMTSQIWDKYNGFINSEQIFLKEIPLKTLENTCVLSCSWKHRFSHSFFNNLYLLRWQFVGFWYGSIST